MAFGKTVLKVAVDKGRRKHTLPVSMERTKSLWRDKRAVSSLSGIYCGRIGIGYLLRFKEVVMQPIVVYN